MKACDCPSCRRIADARRDSGFWDLVLDNFSPYEIGRLRSIVERDSVNDDLRRRVASYSVT